MGRLNFESDEASLLKAYRISSLNPPRWEDIDNEDEGPIAGPMSPSLGQEGSDYVDPLGIGNRAVDIKELDSEQRAAIAISSKSFNPKVFLSTVHPNATHQDLSSGTGHLRKVLESRSEAMRVLVEDNFDHFVAVKAATETLHTFMRESVLDPKNEYGSKQFNDKLKQTNAKADQVFLPILENASKAQRVRSTLGVFERSKFFFNLPRSLVESIELGRFDVALREYNKGKALIDSRGGQIILGAGALSSASASAETSNRLEIQQRRIVDKVWHAVENIMTQMKSLLVAQLRDPSRGVEEQTKTIEVLLDMNPAEDPVWIYFDHQHKHILAHLRKIYDEGIRNIEDAQDALQSKPPLSDNLREELRASLMAVGTNSFETVVGKGRDGEVWSANMALARNLSEGLLTSLPPFWKIAKDYLDGKFKKSGVASSRRSPSQCRTMAHDIVQLYISLLSEHFALSDKAVATTDSTPLPQFVPHGANLVVTAHHLSKILTDVGECVTDVTTAELSGEAALGLKNLLESARWKFEVAVCQLWLQDAVRLHELENWELDPERPTTTYLATVQKFTIHAATSAYKIAGGVDPSKFGVAAKQIPIGRDFSQRIQKSFVDSLYALLDGLEKLSREDYDPPVLVRTNERGAVLIGSTPGMTGSTDLLVPAGCNPKDRDTRMLLVISAYGHMSRQVIPGLVNQLESALGVAIGNERGMLAEVVDQLDNGLFADYIEPKAKFINGIIRKGVLEGKMNWLDTPRPTEVREYVYRALLYLVGIHAQVTAVVKPLLERTMTTLVDDMVKEAYACFQKVEKFGMGGMLAATLEIEFIHQTIAQYLLPPAQKTVASIYNTISNSYTRRPNPTGPDTLQTELEGVKRTLHESRRATAIEFLCFKPTKDLPSSSAPTTGGSR